MKANKKKSVLILLISVVSAAVIFAIIFIIVDFIMAMYAFKLIIGNGPEPYTEEQMVDAFISEEDLFTDLLQEITAVDFSGMNQADGDTEELFPLDPEGTYFDEGQKAAITRLADELRCDKIAVRDKSILLVTFYDADCEPYTFSHRLSDAQSYDEFLELSRSFSTDGKVQQMHNGWLFYPGM